MLDRRGGDDHDISRRRVPMCDESSTGVSRERTRALLIRISDRDLNVEREEVSSVPRADRSTAKNQCPHDTAIMAVASAGLGAWVRCAADSERHTARHPGRL